MIKISKQKGSALLTALLFSFVLMVVMAALAYNYRASMLTIESLVDDELNLDVDGGYINDLFVSNNINNSISDTIGDFTFSTTVDSISPGFQVEHTNSALYQAEPYLMSHRFTHNFINNGVTEYTKELIFNSLPADTYTSYDNIINPLNVPYVNVDGMTGNFATYKLSSGSSMILDNERGYIGNIIQNGTSLNISAAGTNTVVGIQGGLSEDDYKLSIGWNLKDGLWNLLLATYDTGKVYTSSTTLRNLVDNSAQAQTDLNTWNQVVGLPSGSSIPSGSVILTKWIHDADNEVPKPVILRKQERTDGSDTYDLVIYRTTYNSGVYTVKTPAKVEATDDFDVTKVFMVVPDEAFTLEALNARRPLVFFQDDGVTKVIQFNTHNADGVVNLGNLGGSIFGGDLVQAEPILVRRNELQNYLIYHDDNYYYTHVYRAGSLNTTAIIAQGVSGTIQKLIPKFGALFIVTDTNIYVDDFDYSTFTLVNKISINNSDAQILRDDNGLIYAMPDGLDCIAAGDCDTDDRLYIRDEGSCASYTGGCDKIDELNNIAPYLGLIYKKSEH
ncbi:hypothetical protein [Francisella adeliensis]|uniref:Uncharacterized protein n=1 Tax=Francisella adeliensis TaxID=2007306 RepID=A0A2Z4XYE3_9GAMM|nr:hypothetical protein [Francisella adeliensis]AXA33445.1 hypothetical protein CDH04_03010 [Francisella adeliensis]MBK2085465.1 hypothetical protein [Francisella adeliensis]MBK2097195.1 hypothetical protein [Francisella adeliensis]QIW11673.1 hypothetical protein FZC43_03010 [Francisella adeliensis]QIW13548.1 hypothetical protein FZC44_03010 [Francisella adeliensis]